MKKLHLEVDELRVESFETADGDAGQGTVVGHVSPRCTAGFITCNGEHSCEYAETCGAWPSCWVGGCGETFNC